MPKCKQRNQEPGPLETSRAPTSPPEAAPIASYFNEDAVVEDPLSLQENEEDLFWKRSGRANQGDINFRLGTVPLQLVSFQHMHDSEEPRYSEDEIPPDSPGITPHISRSRTFWKRIGLRTGSRSRSPSCSPVRLTAEDLPPPQPITHGVPPTTPPRRPSTFPHVAHTDQAIAGHQGLVEPLCTAPGTIFTAQTGEPGWRGQSGLTELMGQATITDCKHVSVAQEETICASEQDGLG